MLLNNTPTVISVFQMFLNVRVIPTLVIRMQMLLNNTPTVISVFEKLLNVIEDVSK